jgi:tetratricopeptide (TPR) repeat protein
MAARQSLIVVLAAPMLLAFGCVAIDSRTSTPRMSDLVSNGDDLFRASQRLVLEGLEADERGDAARARSRYERALQIDASNPWVYLALARHYVEAGEPARALSHLDRAEALLESQDTESPGAQLHCDGLRGAALELDGHPSEARPLLDSAARGAPDVWGDGRLSASELR